MFDPQVFPGGVSSSLPFSNSVEAASRSRRASSGEGDGPDGVFPRADRERTRVLVVEDDLQVADFTKRSLERLGYAAEVAFTGPDGLALAFSGRFALVVLDWRVPGLSDGGVLHALRRAGLTIPVMVVSGYHDEQAAALAAGADVFVRKPWRNAAMGPIIEGLLARAMHAGPPDRAAFGRWTTRTLAMLDQVTAALPSDTAVMDPSGRLAVLRRLGRALGELDATVPEFSAGGNGLKAIVLATPGVTRVTIAEARRLVAVLPLDLKGQHAAVIDAMEYIESAPRESHPLRLGIFADQRSINSSYAGDLLRDATGRHWDDWAVAAHLRESVRALVSGTRWIERSATGEWGWSSRQQFYEKLRALIGVGGREFSAIVRQPARPV